MNKRLLPRHVQGSVLVDTAGKFETLAALLDQKPKSLKLETLFSTRSSGWTNPAAFHTACDQKGPTLVLIQCADGVSYGGYTSISWTSNNQWQADAKAFLFRISNFINSRTQQVSEKFARNGNGQDVYGGSACGPAFGTGNDLLTFSASGQILTCVAKSFSTPGPLIPGTVSRNATNCHMEVLLVSTVTSGLAEELEAPWLTGCPWSVEVYFMWSTSVVLLDAVIDMQQDMHLCEVHICISICTDLLTILICCTYQAVYCTVI